MKIKLTENQFQRIVKEMRFDGKSTGLFSEEEPVTELYKSTYKNAAADAVEEENDELRKVNEALKEENISLKREIKKLKESMKNDDSD